MKRESSSSEEDVDRRNDICEDEARCVRWRSTRPDATAPVSKVKVLCYVS